MSLPLDTLLSQMDVVCILRPYFTTIILILSPHLPLYLRNTLFPSEFPYYSDGQVELKQSLQYKKCGKFLLELLLCDIYLINTTDMPKFKNTKFKLLDSAVNKMLN
jgi:hypothetical protein